MGEVTTAMITEEIEELRRKIALLGMRNFVIIHICQLNFVLHRWCSDLLKESASLSAIYLERK